MPGPKFSMSPLDDPNVLRARQAVPGPDKYDPAPLKTGFMKKILGGAMEPKEKDEKFPGPGTYNPGGSYDPEGGNVIKGVPSFKIVKPG